MSLRSALLLGATALLLLAAGCGSGSKGTSSSASASTAATGTSATAATVTAPTSTPTTSTIPSSNGSPTAVLPANFVVNADGTLSPPLVAGPAQTTIQLTVTSHASHPVQVAVASDRLTVPPHAVAGIHIAGLNKGRHRITVDGRAAGVLVIGAQPGP